MGLHGIPNPEEDTDISGVVQIRDTLQMGPEGKLKAKDKFIFYDQSDNELVRFTDIDNQFHKPILFNNNINIRAKIADSFNIRRFIR